MAGPDYLVLVVDKQLVPLGDPIACWTMIDVTLRFNEPGSGLFTVPGYSWIRDQLVPGCRIVVIRNGDVLIAGPMEKALWERSDDGENAGAGQVTVTFADFLSLIVARLTYLDATLNASSQVTDVLSQTANAETILRGLVSLQAGPQAQTVRQIPKLVLGTVAGVGSTITYQATPMEPFGDLLRRVAVAGGNLGFKADLVGSQVEFSVYAPQDLSNQVIFGFGAGSLKYIAYEVTAPIANAAVVGGQGDGADRYMIERLNDGSIDAWDRREVLVSRPGNDPVADLNTAGDEALADGAETIRVPISAADTPFQQFGRDYPVGAKVSVESSPGSMIVDTVVTVHIAVYPTAGEVVSPTVGSQAASSDPRWVQRMRALDRRVAYLERNVVPSTP